MSLEERMERCCNIFYCVSLARGVTYGNFGPDVHFQVLAGSQGPCLFNNF